MASPVATQHKYKQFTLSLLFGLAARTIMIGARTALVTLAFLGVLLGLRFLSHDFQNVRFRDTIAVEFNTVLHSDGAFDCREAFQFMRNFRYIDDISLRNQE